MPAIFCTNEEFERVRKLPEITAQRDELLAALKEARKWIKNWSPDFTQDDEWGATQQRIDAAIARAEGR